MLPELAEEFVNVPCDRVLFVRKQLKISVCVSWCQGWTKQTHMSPKMFPISTTFNFDVPRPPLPSILNDLTLYTLRL